MHLTTWTITISKLENSQTNQQTQQSNNRSSMHVHTVTISKLEDSQTNHQTKQ